MATTFTLISTITVGSGGASSIDFTSIPSTFTDLCLKVSTRADNAAAQNSIAIRFNSDTGSNYTYRRLYGTGSASGSDTGTYTLLLCGYIDAANQTANTFGNTEIYIPNYTSSNQKSVSIDSVNENNATSANASLVAGLWTGTATISAIKLLPFDSASFVQYSSASLYGILKA